MINTGLLLFSGHPVYLSEYQFLSEVRHLVYHITRTFIQYFYLFSRQKLRDIKSHDEKFFNKVMANKAHNAEQ